MKTEISAFDLRFLVKELQPLVGERIDKMYILADRGVLVTFGNKQFLQAAPGKCWIPSIKPETPSGLHPFAAKIRKFIGNSKISHVAQVCSERILAIHVMRSEKPYILYMEIFGRGNVILCDGSGIILAALAQNPRVKSGQAYELPKSIDTFHLDYKAFASHFMSSQENVSKTLAVEFRLGKTIAEELCIKAGIPADSAKSEDRARELHQILMELLEKKPSPQLIHENNVLIDATPIQFDIYANKKRENIDTLGQALDRIFSVPASEIKEQKLAPVQKQMQKIDKMIEMQKKSFANLEQKAVEERKKGEYMYEHHQELNKLLTDIIEARKKLSWKEVKAKFSQIKEIDEATGDVTVEL